MTAPTVADLDSKTLTNAHRQFVELYGSALVWNTYLKIVVAILLLLLGGALALTFRIQAQAAQLKPLVVRIDAVGRAEAVEYDATAYKPQAPELRYFLTRFVVAYFSRQRATIQREYPDSLFFLDAALADATMRHNEQHRLVEQFLADATADEVDVVVRNVSLSELANSPYRAAVDFQKVFSAVGTRQERRRETYVAQIDFVMRPDVPNAFVPVNPLGLQITHFRIDQAFEETQPR